MEAIQDTLQRKEATIKAGKCKSADRFIIGRSD